jgi:hypothetical protein
MQRGQEQDHAPTHLGHPAPARQPLHDPKLSPAASHDVRHCAQPFAELRPHARHGPNRASALPMPASRVCAAHGKRARIRRASPPLGGLPCAPEPVQAQPDLVGDFGRRHSGSLVDGETSHLIGRTTVILARPPSRASSRALDARGYGAGRPWCPAVPSAPRWSQGPGTATAARPEARQCAVGSSGRQVQVAV